MIINQIKIIKKIKKKILTIEIKITILIKIHNYKK
jgi:hypothetical protein